METFTHKQKKIAVINDLSGYGRCSLTVALPILSAMGHQACPVPTAILSSHTEFPVYFLTIIRKKCRTMQINGCSWACPLTVSPQGF